ncbi:MAG: hypothetical protein HZB85_06755 [Deltaproteobacteria bacterium]|nr:hypothetical protein [Deltaproteobacteria bacterium]
MMRYVNLIVVLLLIMLAGCDQASMMKMIASSEDQQVAKDYIDLLRQSKFEQIEKDLDQSIKSENIHDVIVKMAALIPSQTPQSIKLVGANTFSSSDRYESNLTFEYQFPNEWIVVNVAIRKKGGISTIIGFNVSPISDSLENLNRFTLSGKSLHQYAVLALAVLFPLFSLYALIMCILTKMDKRKWIWILFIVFGVGKFAIDWTTGQWSVKPLSVQLFSAAAFAPPYGAWTLSVSLPLGAILFTLRKKKPAEPAPLQVDSAKRTVTDGKL